MALAQDVGLGLRKPANLGALDRNTMKNDFISLISSGFCAFRARHTDIVHAFTEWQTAILAPLGDSVVSAKLSGNADSLVSALYPLVSPVRTRNLFMDGGDGWIVALDNGFRGTDAGVAPVLSRRCECQSVRAVSLAHTMKPKEGVGVYGAEIFESYECGTRVRTIFCANDGGRWKFGQSGTPYPVEDLSRYTRRAVRERFTHTELVALLKHLQIRAFEPDWYLQSGVGRATLVSRVGELPANYREHGTGVAGEGAHPCGGSARQ